jgi:hypothetical protein
MIVVIFWNNITVTVPVDLAMEIKERRKCEGHVARILKIL